MVIPLTTIFPGMKWWSVRVVLQLSPETMGSLVQCGQQSVTILRNLATSATRQMKYNHAQISLKSHRLCAICLQRAGVQVRTECD